MIIRKLLSENINIYLKNNRIFSKYEKSRFKSLKKMESNLKKRDNPVVTKLNSVQFQSIFTPELKFLMELFKKYNFELRIAGGAVRDLLMNNEPKDIDFATTATPEEMKNMFNQEEIRLINMKGEKHGTITPRINDTANFEITTLRIDVLTDGRFAEVEFTKDWELDANRRDLTINSMFLGLDGSIYDYFYGYEDLQQKRIVFVGNACTRIQEDYLRILRYFRFYGRISEKPDNHDEATIQSIQKNVAGLQQISGERIWSEMKKILNGKFAFELIVKMLECNIGPYIGLPVNVNIEEMKRLFKNSSKFDEPHLPIIYFIGLLNDVDDSINLHARLKLSAFERDLSFFITQNRDSLKNEENILVYKKLCVEVVAKKEILEETLKYLGKTDLYSEFKAWQIPKFQITGMMLKENGCPIGKKMGVVMSALKTFWADDNFQTSVDDLLKIHLPKILVECKANNYANKKLKLI